MDTKMSVYKAQIPFSEQELFDYGPRRPYVGRQLDEIAFPLGGIGTGSVSVGGWGQLRDWEIFNRPAKGNTLNFCFFSLWAQSEGGPSVAKVIQGPKGGGYVGRGHGLFGRKDGAGLPHFRENSFTGAYPLAKLDFKDPEMPLEVAIEAFNPFIPLNDKDSSIPVAIFLVHLTNSGDKRVRATLFANLENRAGYPDLGGNLNTFKKDENIAGLYMTSEKHRDTSPRFGTMALTTTHSDLTVLTRWARVGWFDSLIRFWDQIEAGEFSETPTADPSPDVGDFNPFIPLNSDVGTIGLKLTLEPGQSEVFPIIISWHFPNFEKYWHRYDPEGCCEKPKWKNYYATLFQDAWDVASYVANNLERLEKETRLFQRSLFESTLPSYVLDAVSSQISTLKTSTCLRLEDGTFYGWEGCSPDSGCCEGTCTHVWNYAQTLPYLFPKLERSIRNADYRNDLHSDGHMTFRMPLPLGTPGDEKFHAAADGQMGNILRVYREWLISGDEDWLREIWPSVKSSLEFAWLYWDADKDGVMEGVQHNTYDVEFYGPNTMMGSLYLGALRSAEEIARHFGEDDKADEYRGVFESGRAWMDEHLFNGEWYEQSIDPEAGKNDPRVEALRRKVEGDEVEIVKEGPKYQYGSGCLSDQMLGQWYARMLLLGDLFNPEKVRKTASSIFNYNFRDGFFDYANPQRIYALNEERGLILCSWPRGGRPKIPFPYSNEVWTGIEYAVASFLIYEGLLEEGLTLVKSARDRHDGTRRNPWDEFECGHHYARAMASYSVLLALSGFHYSAPEQHLSFAPVVNAEDFRSFFSVETSWGVYSQKITDSLFEARVEIRAGEMILRSLGIALSRGLNQSRQIAAYLGFSAIPVKLEVADERATLIFSAPARIEPGIPLEVKIGLR